MTVNWRGGEGSLVRLKVQIILRTYCLEEGGRKHSHGWTEAGEVGWDKKGWCQGGWVEEGGGGSGSWLFQHRG